MRVWITAVFLLFALVQFYQWVTAVMLPLPIYVLAGAFLAIASNYEGGINNFIQSSTKNNSAAQEHSFNKDDMISLEKD